MIRQLIRVTAIGLLLVFIAAGLLPHSYWTAGWVRYRLYQGTFNGRPVILTAPSVSRAAVPLEYEIEMTSGVCEIAGIDRAGRMTRHCTMGRGYTLLDALPVGEQLRLDPASGTGRYVVRIGLKYHPLSPFLWRVLAIGTLVGLVLVSAVRIIWKSKAAAWQAHLKSLLAPWQWAVLGLLAGFTGAILYPAIHESGHALVGLALGAEVKHIVFTPLGGEVPHVSFGELPDRAGAWNSAGAIFLPMLVAWSLVLIWLLLGPRLGRFAQALLLTPAVFLLFASFGIDDHLRSLAVHLGFASEAGIMLVKLIPPVLTLAAYALIGWRIWRSVQQSSPTSPEPAAPPTTNKPSQ